MNPISFFNLTKTQISIIKGIAIIMIVLHNFLHWLNQIGENELDYDFSHLKNLWESISSAPESIFSGLFTYFGHFGVQLFVFVSGYGLTKKYLNGKSINYKEFIVYRFLKIYSLVFAGLSLMFLYNIIYQHKSCLTFLKDGLNVLLMTNNFSYDKIFSYIGPWWFFSLILQLYLLFPFIYKYLQEKQARGFYLLLAISYVLIYALWPVAENFRVPLFGNFLGHLPEFLLGIAIASFPKMKLDIKILSAALFVFTLSNISIFAFPLGFLSVTVLLLVAIHPVFFLSEKNIIVKTLSFTGKISMFLFLINGPLRSLTLNYAVGKSLLIVYIMAIIHLAIAIGISYLLSVVYDRTLLPIINKLFTDIVRFKIRIL